MLRSGTVLAVVAAVVLPAAAMAATTSPILASTIDDSRIDESSSLVVSARHPGIAYTANDENDPVYAVELSTGKVVGTARLVSSKLSTQSVRVFVPKRKYAHKPNVTCTTKKQQKRKCKRVTRQVTVEELDAPFELVDPEALSRDSAGRIWLADTGDNDEDRDDVALYAFGDPGPGDRQVLARRYPITYPGGESYNVETLLIHPVTNAKFLVTKADDDDNGKLFALPRTLRRDVANAAVDLGKAMPEMVSDGGFSPRGTRVILRDGTKGSERAHVISPTTWTTLGTIAVPNSEDGKGESVSFDPKAARFLTSREGESSPLYWVPFDESTWTASTH